MVKPVNKCILVELKGEFNNLPHQDERFNTTKSRGVVLAIADDAFDEEFTTNGSYRVHHSADGSRIGEYHSPTDLKELIKVDSIVYFNAYEDNCSWKEGGKEYALIEAKIIKGVANASPREKDRG